MAGMSLSKSRRRSTLVTARGESASGTVSLSSPGGRAVIAAAVFGSALAYMSDDMLNVALPTLADDLDVGVSDAQWIVNGYFVTMLSLMLAAGSIGDIRGHRRSFLEGIGVFCAGALTCAFAPGLTLLIAGRSLQGVGAALLLASGLALVNGSFIEDERSRAVGVYMGLTAVTTAAGPALGGLLVDSLSWRAVFLAPLVFPLVAIVVTANGVPERPIDPLRRPDVRGAVLAFVMIAGFSVALIRVPDQGFGPVSLIAVIAGCVGAVLFLASQRRREDPMLPLDLFENRTFLGGNLVTLVFYMVSAGAFFFLVVHLQTTLDYGAAAAGAALIPIYVIMVVGSPLSGRLADHVGARRPIVAGLLVFAAGVAWLSRVDAHSDYWLAILPGLVVLAVGLSVASAPLTAATLGAVDDDDKGIASGVNNTVGQLGGLLMIAVLPAVAGLSGASFDGDEFAGGYETAMRVCVALVLGATVIAATTIKRVDELPVSHERK